ncbi:amidase [Bremerella cremea]|uniref:Amidase n=1 Tax=Blastopirellula marina TaxID=124 RepID=A0A2S8G7S2_9BACT|nr:MULTISPECIES: amidase [Pirellulaceae]PQO40477.1 amidase [Blastopirellula marina]RCS52059.1 amidase [Bremerella cremea]
MPTPEVADMTAGEMTALFATRELSPVEATKACLQRIEQHNSKVNAYNIMNEELTLEAAKQSEQRWQLGTPLGPIDGVPVAVKDIFITKGWPNRKGSTLTSPDPLKVDAPAIAALRRNGFVPLGRTTTPEFGWKGVTDNPLDGVTSNPWDPTKVSGGSSGGSGAAVPLGMGPLALGTDAGGSIRIPAGFCGVVGHKPTHGVCPMWPPSSFYPLAHVGPMTWTVADAALLMDVLAEPDARDMTLPSCTVSFRDALDVANVMGMRIAYSPNLGYVDVDPEVEAAVNAAASAFEEAGAIVETCDPGFSDPLEAFDILFYGGAANALRDIGPEDRAKMDPNLIKVAQWGSERSLLDYMGAANVRAELTEKMSLFHQTWDLLLTPTLPIPAFDAGLEVPKGWHHERWPTWTPFTYPFNMTGQPAVSVPCGFTKSGLPIGLQIIGPRHADVSVLQAAHYYQQVRPLTSIRPKMLTD